MLAEILRIGFGTKAVGWDNLVYGVLLVVFIIFPPRGCWAASRRRWKRDASRRNKRAPSPIESVEAARQDPHASDLILVERRRKLPVPEDNGRLVVIVTHLGIAGR